MFLRQMLALAVTLSAPLLLAATLPSLEPMPTLDAATLVPAGLLKGAGYTVDATAPTAGVATAISTTATVSNLVWDKSPEDVRTMNEQKLAAMGVGAATVRAFVTNRWFTPTISVPFVERLAQMPTAKGDPAADVAR